MSSQPSRSVEARGAWLAIAMGLVILAALVSSTRAKPAIVFGGGFGLAVGVALRFLADSLGVTRNRRVGGISVLLAGCGFLLCFMLSDSRAAHNWDRIRFEEPTDPIAAAVLKSANQDAPMAAPTMIQPYSIGKYLERRLPGWPSPWPEVLFGAEWIICGVITGVCVGFGQSTRLNPASASPHNDHHTSG